MLPAIDSAKPAPTIIAHRLQPTGALREDALYIERSADQDLLGALTAGEFCYVLAPRQIGKSSLRARTARRLKRANTHCAEIDLTSLGKSADRDPVGTWYFSLANRIADDLGLDDPKSFFESLAALLPVERFGQFLRRQVLSQVAGNIVIFLDEIDYVRALPIDCDEFFVALRALYNERPQHPELERLTFCLLGVAAPRDLVRDPHITPFNIGQPIRLIDFRCDELVALAPALAPLEGDPTRWLDEVYAWTGGHPYMTQVLCQELVKQRGPQAQGTVAERVQRAVSMRFLRSGRSVDENLSYAEKRLQQSPHKAELLILYRRLLGDARVPLDTGDAIQQELMMCGLAALRDACEPQPLLQVRNRVFARVFDAAWVQEKEAQRLLTTAYRRWHEAGGRDVDLLATEELALAQTWAQEHPREISSQEHEFLLRCVDHARQKAEQDKHLSESNLAHERLRSAEQSARTQRRIIFGLLLSLLLLAGLSLALYLQYRRAQASIAAEAAARTAADQAAAREAEAARKAQELAQGEVAARKQIEALATAKQQEWERAEAMQKEASTAKSVAEQKIREVDEQIRKTSEARADLDESRRQNDSISAARLAMFPQHRLAALVQGLHAVEADVKSGKIHPEHWEGLTAAATHLVGSLEVKTDGFPYVLTATASRDAQQVAVGGLDGRVGLFSVANGKRLWLTPAHQDAVWDVSFSPDMAYLASSGVGGDISILIAKTGERVLYRTKQGACSYVDFVDNAGKFEIRPCKNWSKSSQYSNFPENINSYLNAGRNSNKSIADIDEKSGIVRSKRWVFSQDAALIASVRDTPISTSILDGKTGHPLWILLGQSSICLHFTPDNRRLVTSGIGGTLVRLWNLEDVIGRTWQVPVTEIKNHTDILSSTSEQLLSRRQNELIIQDIHGKNKIRKLVPQSVNSLSTHSKISLFNWAQNDSLLWAIIDTTNAGANEQNKARITTQRSLHVWRASDGTLKQVTELPAASANKIVTASKNGQHGVFASGKSWYRFSIHDEIAVSEIMKPWYREWEEGGLRNPFDDAAINNDGTQLLTIKDDQLFVFDMTNGRQVAAFDLNRPFRLTPHIEEAEFSHSGRFFLAQSNRDLFMFDMVTQNINRLSGHIGKVNAFVLSPDDRLIASAADDGTVRLWQVETRKQWLVVPVDEPVQQIRFIDGGTKILALQKNGVVRTFPVDHMAYFRHGCRVLRGYSSITGVSEADRKEALSACPPPQTKPKGTGESGRDDPR